MIGLNCNGNVWNKTNYPHFQLDIVILGRTCLKDVNTTNIPTALFRSAIDMRAILDVFSDLRTLHKSSVQYPHVTYF